MFKTKGIQELEDGTVYLTAKIKSDLNRIAVDNGVRKEAVANVILRLTFSDESKLKSVINFIKACNIGGEKDLENKGW